MSILRRSAVFLLLAAAAAAQPSLPGAEALTESGDLAARMVDGIHAFLDRHAPPAATGSRERLRKLIGAVDPRLPVNALVLDATTAAPARLATGPRYSISRVRWPVFDGVDAEGLLLDPTGAPAARVVALPDADSTPEMLAGLQPGLPPEAQYARALAELGCQVLVPVLIDRKDTWSGAPAIRMTNQPHREFIYRMSYEVGRHIIGYEVQKALAAVDWFTQENARRRAPIAIAGYGEGALLALYSAALDQRIEAALVSGYFQAKRQVWREPIYRNVWSVARGFDDVSLARMIAPRKFVVEAARAPEIAGPPPETKDRRGATPNGAITTPPIELVRQGVRDAGSHARLVEGAPAAALLDALGVKTRAVAQPLPSIAYDPAPRLKRQFDQLVRFTQDLARSSPARRAQFWAKADRSSPARWRETTRSYRDYIWDEMIGRLPAPDMPARPRVRLIFDEPKFRGYEVLLDVWPDVIAYGILLVPKGIHPGERRPVVVCQHGLEGRPRDVADPAVDHRAYHRYAVRLAEEGFITYAPQNPYIGEDRFRTIVRKAHPLQLSLYSFILGQHQQTLAWLRSLPFVDPARIGFYGLSYGGKTAVRIPPLLDEYALSICSADFNEWVWKNTSVEAPYSYMFTREYDMLEFDLANIANYAELASLMAPRPFMVERGHEDGVAPDEWVAYEYAKVRRFYAYLKIPDKTAIEFFPGPHTINGQGTFAFLRRHLSWPR
jgi:dienelactone hydrolase